MEPPMPNGSMSHQKLLKKIYTIGVFSCMPYSDRIFNAVTERWKATGFLA
jgi:hypothetical protein